MFEEESFIELVDNAVAVASDLQRTAQHFNGITLWLLKSMPIESTEPVNLRNVPLLLKSSALVTEPRLQRFQSCLGRIRGGPGR